MKLLLLGEKCEPFIKTFEEGLDKSWIIERWQTKDGKNKLIDLYQETEIIVTAMDAMSGGNIFKYIPEAKNLKLVQIPFVGVDWLDTKFIPSSVMIANASGHEIAMAEYTIGVILSLALDLNRMDKTFRNGSWEDWPGNIQTPSIHKEIYGKTLGIIGHGLIGKECAKRAKALGMKVLGINRQKRESLPSELDWHGTSRDLDKVLSESDYLLLACDLNKSTFEMINKNNLFKMKKDSYLINIARGNVCNEEDLFNHLSTNQIAGAAIDTWWVYPYTNPEDSRPKPSGFPFHELENVIMSPHNSSHTLESDIRRAEYMLENFKAFKKGIEVPGFVFYGTGVKQGI